MTLHELEKNNIDKPIWIPGSSPRGLGGQADVKGRKAADRCGAVKRTRKGGVVSMSKETLDHLE